MVSYVHLTCDFTMLGITRDSFVDKTLNIFKSVPICDVLQNWRLLVADENKTFNSKCEEILCILRYLQKESSMQRREIIAQVFKATTTSPLFPSHVEEKFCLASQMCLNQHQPVFERTFYRINSYLCKNDEISVFLQNLGIAKDFEPIFYKRFLENCESIENEIQAIQVRDILEYLRSRKEMVGKLPDDNDKFRNVEELCLNDFELKESLTEISPLHCHRIIPHDLALFFGVKTKRSMLETLSSDPSFESFSQKEDLCNRLYRITTSYSNPMDMFKELIQNADDARASEIQFILDDRNLPKQRVVNDNWEKLLEPALLVFNDAFFTSDDIKGIKDLGRGSKGDDVDKIGQFGVGFNCVFSITDYPCFLTQVDGQGPGNMCLLDPSCQITPHQGKKININQDLLKNFPDTFGCFLAANRKLDGRKGKTMFRLPFRRNESSLGKRAPNCSEMYEKLQQLAAKVPEYLLFLRNIKTIRISRTNPAGNLTEIAAFSKSIDKLTSELSKVQINSISSRSKKVSEWLLNEREISSQQIPSIVHRSLFLRDLKLREHGAVAFPLFLDDSVKNEVPGVYCYLPIEEASAHLRAESVAIPVVVNGQFFLDESRRMISLQPQEPKGTWNIHILQHVVGPAYGALIRYFTSTIKTQIAPGDSIHYFLSMLPKLRTSSQLVPKSMQSNLGYHISLGMMRFNADYAWIPSVNTDKKIVDFLNLASIRNLMVSNGQTNNKDLILYKISSALHIPLTQIGPEYVKCWAQVGIVITSLSPNDVISKLADAYIQPTRIEETAFENSSNLVVFLNWSKKELSAHPDPKSLPIFLSANGILLRNTANELYSSALSIADIFPRLRGRILDIDVDGCLRPLKLACNLEVDEFFAYMAVHFNQILVDQIVCWSQVTGEINERWVRLVWNFLAHHQKEVLEKFLVLLKKMSILLCSDKRGVLKLMPLSMSTDYVFSSFQIIRIGSVSINTKDYSSFYRISDELHHIGTQRKAFASKFIMPSILTVERHLHILHVINKENHFDKFSDTQRKQLYSYFRDSFCNDQSIFRTNEIDKLRQLPIFSFVKSTVGCQPLSVFNSVVSMSRDVPLVGLTLADNEVNRVFVHREALTQGAAFQEKLGIESISDSELYSIFIPNFFPHMKNSEMKTHFHYLERKLSDMTQADQNLLKDTLQKTEYVADEHGNKLVLGNVAQIELRIMVGYIMPITDFNAVGIAQIGLVDKLVGAYKIPKVSEILSNWKMLSDDSSKEFDLKCSEIREIIDYLAKNLDKGAYEQVADALKKHNLLPANGVNQFCRSASICLDENAPVYNGYLYRVNFLVTKGCQNLSKLFLRNCKLVDKFAPSEYSELINSFQTVESPEQIQQIVLILWFICKDGYKVDYVDIRQLPDTYSRMRPIDELCLDDMELSRNALEDSLNFCHEALPHQLCKNLGVKTKRSKLKEMNSDHRFESFFQREDIKERLARIAESYSNPMDIFKELIQNADDAQATQVHFILDQRKLPAKYVIDHGFEKLLDPALLVYNNVPFKTSDIEGIQRVGSGSKGDDVEKIGQFGVGFNCVYSLTDFPCFLTQVDGVGLGNLLLLDPQGVIIEQGGCKIDVRSETYMEAVKDSFNCFLRENEQLDATNGGSMFRFPLRVKRSKLGKAAPILSEMEEKMNEFSSKIAEYLLFVNNITSIKVSVLKETGTMRCLGAFSKTFSGDNETALKEFRSHTRQFLSVSYRHELLTKRNIIYNIDIIDDMRGKKIAAWKVSEQLGSERSVPDIIRKSTTGKCKIKQHASVAIPLFLDGRLKHKVPGLYCYLPVEDASSQLRNESVEIPVVVNGQFFLDESRRMLSLQSREPKGAWNIHVLQDIVGPAYAKMLKQFIEHWTENKASFHLNEFLNKFPCCRDNNLELKATDNMASFVTRGFLCEMNKFNWIPCMSFVHELFEFESVTCAKNVAYLANDNLSFSIYSTSQNLGVKLTRLPLKYTILWDCYGASLSKMTPTDIICLLRELPDHPLKIEESVFRSVQNLAVFLQWSSNELLTLGSANDLPIYLTADGFLLKNSSIQLYSSALSIAQIFPHLSNRIMHHDIDQLLKKLKMTREMKLEEFLDYLKKYNPDYCQGKVIEINPGEVYQMSRWVELVWVFLHARINPHSIVTDSTFDNFSVLLCTDKNRGIFMRPISAGKVDTFLKLDKFLIGSVEICTEKYNGLYNLVDSLKKENLAWSKLVASAVLSKNLNIQQQITILRIIKDEFDFNESERLQLYQYFKNVFQNTSSIDQESINYLRELPIFAIIPDQVDSLLGGLCVYSVPREIPRQGLNLSASVAYKYVYEEITPKAIEFQKRLGIINFTTTQMYVETIIPLLFERFELNCLSVHLDFISEILPQLSIDNRKVILICLSQCKFIHTNDDHKREPKCFYDRSCPLFLVFKDGHQMLPWQYVKFRDLLSLCGLNHTVTEDDFWDFITRYSANPSRENSLTILGHFLKSFRGLKLSPNKFSKVGRLPIFETEKHGYQKLCDVYLNQHTTLVEFVEPVLNFDTSFLLQEKPINLKSFWQIWLDQENSGLEKKPTAAIVLKNLEKLIQSESPNDSKNLKCLRFIAEEASSGTQMDRSILERLSCIPCVTSGNGKLLPPRQICKSFECRIESHDLLEVQKFSGLSYCELGTYVNEPSSLFMAEWDYLQILGATKFVTLQQTAFAVHQFYGVVMTGDIWNKNPNSLNRFFVLKDHFEELVAKKPSELSSLSSECPLYDITIDENMVDISGAVVIDKPSLYSSLQESSLGTESHSQDDSTRLFPDSSVIDVNSSYAENLKLLPAPLRPKFFSEICHIEIDSSTFEESNSAAEQFHLERISAKLQNDLFIEKLAHVLEHREKLVHNYLSQNESRNQKKFETPRLVFLKNCTLRPVKRLYFQYSIDINGKEINGIIEREFDYRENPNPEIFFTISDISSETQPQEAKRSKELFKEITKHLFVPEKLDCYQLDTQVIKFLAKLIFVCRSEDEEGYQLRKFNIPPFNRVSIAKDRRDLLVGNIVPLAFCALIDYSTDQKVKYGDIVAIQESCVNKHELVFKYAKYVGEVHDSNDSSNHSVRCLLFRIQVDRDTILNLNPKQVFTFRDKLDTGTNESQLPSIDENTEEEQFERDVMNIRQIISTAVTSQKPGERLDSNMDELERRLLQSYLRKYSSPDQQQKLIRIVSESIGTEKEAHNIEAVAEAGDASRTINQTQQPEPDMRVNNFLKLNFERMNREINAHTEQLKVHKKRKNHGTFYAESFRRPQSLINYRGRSSHSNLGIQFHIEALTQPQPNPTLAKLWLKQAKEHWMFLNGKVEEDRDTNQESYRNWRLEISLKVCFFNTIAGSIWHNSLLQLKLPEVKLTEPCFFSYTREVGMTRICQILKGAVN